MSEMEFEDAELISGFREESLEHIEVVESKLLDMARGARDLIVTGKNRVVEQVPAEFDALLSKRIILRDMKSTVHERCLESTQRGRFGR